MFEASRLAESDTRFHLLTRVLIAKIRKPADVDESLRQAPVLQGEPGFSCRIWTQSIIATLGADGVLSESKVTTDWDAIERRCRVYAKEKKEAGRWRASASFGPEPKSLLRFRLGICSRRERSSHDRGSSNPTLPSGSGPDGVLMVWRVDSLAPVISAAGSMQMDRVNGLDCI